MKATSGTVRVTDVCEQATTVIFQKTFELIHTTILELHKITKNIRHHKKLHQ